VENPLFWGIGKDPFKGNYILGKNGGENLFRCPIPNGGKSGYRGNGFWETLRERGGPIHGGFDGGPPNPQKGPQFWGPLVDTDKNKGGFPGKRSQTGIVGVIKPPGGELHSL